MAHVTFVLTGDVNAIAKTEDRVHLASVRKRSHERKSRIAYSRGTLFLSTDDLIRMLDRGTFSTITV